MLSIKQFFIACGLKEDPDKIKLVKHVDHASGYWKIRELVDSGAFDFYQSEQGSIKKVFHDCQVIISFMALENNLAELIGVYQVKGFREFNKQDLKIAPRILKITSVFSESGYRRIWYNLERLKEFDYLKNRLIVQWNSTRGWVQRKDLEIYELMPPVKVFPFTGYQDVFIDYKQLKHIFDNPRAHKDWKAALEANAGIYRIVDMSNGAIYIGSAYGNEGLWGRWSTYVKNGHGGNKSLKGLDVNNFRWSIIRTVSRAMAKSEVINIETMEKLKHGSRVHGLNNN